MEFSKGNKEFDVVGLGEVMLRLSPMGSERLTQGELLEKRPGGSELNVVSGVAMLGGKSAILTRLPQSDLGRFIQNRIRLGGVRDDYLIWDSSAQKRLGVYYYEGGASPRKPSVVYDRARSSIGGLRAEEVPAALFGNATIFHTSGITLALGSQVQGAAIELVRRFKEGGALVSFDVNYRANLWGEEEARQTVCAVLPYVDILFISEETSRRMMGRQGTMEDIMRGYCQEYSVKLVASTHRVVKSPKCHSFGSTIYDHGSGRLYTQPPYEDIDVIDRIGSGDAYVAGVLFGLIHFGTVEQALAYGNAMSAVKNTVVGDMPVCSYEEITRICEAHASGEAGGELNR